MKDEPMMGPCAVFLFYQFFKILFNLERSLSLRESKAVGYPENVSVHGNDWSVETDGSHHVSGLAADAGKGHEIRYVVRHIAVKIAEELLAHFQQMVCLAVGIGNGFYIIVDIVF